MDASFADPDVITRLLADSRTWAFVGLNDRPERVVYEQAQLLKQRGKRIYPVHPGRAEVLGEPGYAALDELPEKVDVVGVYRRSEHAGAVIDQAIAAGAGAVWLPLDVVDEEAGRRALEAGLEVVMNRCPAIEWAKRH